METRIELKEDEDSKCKIFYSLKDFSWTFLKWPEG
jgi:hypothetical protein